MLRYIQIENKNNLSASQQVHRAIPSPDKILNETTEVQSTWGGGVSVVVTDARRSVQTISRAWSPHEDRNLACGTKRPQSCHGHRERRGAEGQRRLERRSTLKSRQGGVFADSWKALGCWTGTCQMQLLLWLIDWVCIPPWWEPGVGRSSVERDYVSFKRKEEISMKTWRSKKKNNKQTNMTCA